MPTASRFSPIRLYSCSVCPYVQRVTIALHECGAIQNIQPGKQDGPNGVELIEIDLRNKPAEFLQKVNPAGTVPVMVLNDAGKELKLFESAPIARFVLQHYASPLVKDISDLEEYRANFFAESFAQPFTSAFYPLLSTGAPEHADKMRAVIAKTEALLKANHDASGAKNTDKVYAAGGKFGLADVLCAPFLARLPVLAKYRQFHAPSGPEFAFFSKWIETCANHPSVKATTASESVFFAGYAHMVPNAATASTK